MTPRDARLVLGWAVGTPTEQHLLVESGYRAVRAPHLEPEPQALVVMFEDAA